MTNEERAVAVQEPQVTRALVEFDQQQVELIKRTIAKGTTNEELSLFIQQCRRTALDPFSRQIYCVVRGRGDKRSMTIQTSIDGLRTIAQRSGSYEGQTEPEYRAEKGEWSTEWDGSDPPYEARVGVYRSNFRGPQYARARYSSYVVKDRDGKPNPFWKRMPELMLSKCAESLALRKAFPNEMSGLYSSEEMGDQPPLIEGEGKNVTEPAKQIPDRADMPPEHGASDEIVDPPKPDDAADEQPKRKQTVKALIEWGQELYGYDRKAVYGILDVTNEDGVKDIGLREAAGRIRAHHGNAVEGDADEAQAEDEDARDDAPPPEEPVDGDFREEG